jgi:Spx/MgsR family transcriptional regulator
MTVTVYGIPNCDTVKKARTWLDAQGVAYSFHDYKKQGIDPAKLAEWVGQAGWEKVLNRSGTTFKKLPDDMKAGIDADKAIAIMAAHASAIKRPIVEYPNGLLVGFNDADWAMAPLTA